MSPLIDPVHPVHPATRRMSAGAWIALGLSPLGGLAGLVVVGFVLLVRMDAPATTSGQAARIWGLAACGTASVTGAVGAVVGLVLGMGYPPTAWFAVLEGACIGGVVGLVLGGLVGAVLAVVRLARARS